MTMKVPGKRVTRMRLVHTDKYIIAVEVEAVIPDADPGEVCYEPSTVDFLRDVESHARRGDVEWLRRHGEVYAALDAA